MDIPGVLQSDVKDPGFTVWSHNLRTALREDVDGLNGWSHRRDGVKHLMNEREPSVICLQEATDEMLRFLIRGSDESQSPLQGYRRLGTCRKGGHADEFCAILFDPRQMKLLDNGTIWLSETPQLPPVNGEPSWDAAHPRIATWARFRLICEDEKQRTVCVINTHFDHQGKQARQNSAKILKQLVQDLSQECDCPVICTGDFNSAKTSPVYRELTSARLADAWASAKEQVGGARSTFHKFQGVAFTGDTGDGTVEISSVGPDSLGLGHIDWVLWKDADQVNNPYFTTRRDARRAMNQSTFLPRSDTALGWRVRLIPQKAHVVTDVVQSPDGREVYPSDHFPLCIEFSVSMSMESNDASRTYPDDHMPP